MESKHTQGPWYVTIGNEPIIQSAVLETDNFVCIPEGATPEQAHANAALIAAAPELLDALKAVHSTYRTFRNVPQDEQQWTSIDDNVMAQIEAVIEKAGGAL